MFRNSSPIPATRTCRHSSRNTHTCGTGRPQCFGKLQISGLCSPRLFGVPEPPLGLSNLRARSRSGPSATSFPLYLPWPGTPHSHLISRVSTCKQFPEEVLITPKGLGGIHIPFACTATLAFLSKHLSDSCPPSFACLLHKGRDDVRLVKGLNGDRGHSLNSRATCLTSVLWK